MKDEQATKLQDYEEKFGQLRDLFTRKEEELSRLNAALKEKEGELRAEKERSEREDRSL